jgi:catechol 2,3-dioxygenase-like lactoylglutathione lyase family enzyme
MPSEVAFQAITGFRIVAAEPERLTWFYREIGFTIGNSIPIPNDEMKLLGLTGAGARTTLSLGPSRIDIDCFDQPGRPYPVDTRACDLVFQHLALVTDDALVAWARARDAGAIPISRERPVTLPKSAGGVTAVKFRDPEGHPLELLQFPRDANSHWKGSGIMGIDHSAISVSDIAASRRFYARNGLHESGATINHGPTQVALDGLDDVQVEVVPMIPAKETPHVEMLAYRNPAGRSILPWAINDIAATRIVWQADIDGILRDPDGHVHQLSR